MANKITDQQVYHNLAEKYEFTKKKSIQNILNCGKILQEAKDSMPHGMFGSFLQDTRVSESERTAQRLMVIYRNFRHLLTSSDKQSNPISHLGMSHLLELQKLPERFKKDIEVVKEVEGREIRELVKVVDEERLADFLDKHVEYQGGQKQVRDLPLTEMKRYIREAQGIFDPDQDSDEDEKPRLKPEVTEDGKTVIDLVKPTSEVGDTPSPDFFGVLMGDLAKLSSFLQRLIEEVGKIDKVLLSELTEQQILALVFNLKNTSGLSETYRQCALASVQNAQN